jgi:hypothetical protein
MKNILSAIVAFIGYAVIISTVFTQDTTPRGPAHWTATNWLGFCIIIGLFILAIFGIYRLAIGRRGEEGGLKSERPEPYSGTRDTSSGESGDTNDCPTK